ncbi:hypothetical protein JCM19231_4828 [Vibrio ishigakensis]|uniref:Uncharacterized protein n=1 Tax=Vibrio ishigakensis TaxID=1481914 RepID=A0A0B8P7G3_9VIBR|nr:hypothetical protein [Vibrio ishigakensis]GAM58844.1 hypothetical protein JCM19231_4828 [Vibrio ishigakensis]
MSDLLSQLSPTKNKKQAIEDILEKQLKDEGRALDAVAKRHSKNALLLFIACVSLLLFAVIGGF